MFAPNFTHVIFHGNKEYGTGWRPRYPDRRDYTFENPEVKSIIESSGVKFKTTTVLSSSMDLSEKFPPVKDQGNLGSCTANAASNIVEYYQMKSYGKVVPGSRLFLYKVTRNLQRETGDVGGYLRTTMAALALFGVPPESYYPYNTTSFDIEPSQFLYSIADNYEASCYFSLDPMHLREVETAVLDRIKKYVSIGVPSMFGFFIYPSFVSGSCNGTKNEGYIPFPGDNEAVEGGHAVVVAGYDDSIIIRNDITGSATKGALKILNSWGSGWGLNGYGWLPYKYVETGLACDFWCIVSMEWLDTGRFGL